MRINCPHCGTRDRREFTWIGAAAMQDRPVRDAGPEAWDSYIHLRDNPAGESRELWYHDPCSAIFVAERDTVTHRWGDKDSVRSERASRLTWDEGDLREIPGDGATS